MPLYARPLTALQGIPGTVVRAPDTQGLRQGAVPASSAATMRVE